MPEISSDQAGALPDFVIIGVANCSTTTLISNLARHPDVFAPKIDGGYELNFFNRNWHLGMDWYKSLFNQRDKLQGEKTPAYLTSHSCHLRLATALPDAKLVISLRHPVDRAYSHWNHFNHSKKFQKRNNWRPMPFLDAIRQPVGPMTSILTHGFYARHIRKLFAVFPREQIHITITERLRNDPEKEYGRLLSFLKLQPSPEPFRNANMRSYSEPLDPDIRKILDHHYRAANFDLMELLDDPIPEWSIS